MPNLSERLLESAAAVAALGSENSDFAILDDATVTAGLALVRDHQRNLQAYELGLAAEIARRSSHTFGNSGLARRNGSATPAIFIQSITGSSIDEATKLAKIGEMIVESDLRAASMLGTEGHPDAPQDPDAPDEPRAGAQGAGDGPIAPLATAARSGDISVAAADAIRKGLGKPDDAVTVDQLRAAEAELLADAGKVSPESLLKLARMARNALDLEAIERGAKRRQDIRYVRRWQRDGMSGGSWSLPDEDGGAELHAALGLMLASRTGGPRFPETDEQGNTVVKSAEQVALEDPRTIEQVLADGFAQIVRLGLVADPSAVPAVSRSAVRVMVSELVLDEQSGSALLEENLTPITFAKLEQLLCADGKVGVLFDDHGELVNVGREQRFFTYRQRIGLGVRDGGCRYPGCDKPVSWTEAHHLRQWARDKGETDIGNGILLCRYHHMHIHDTGGEVVRGERIGRPGTFWLKPGKRLDPAQTLIEMPSRNPLVNRLTSDPRT